MAIAKHTPLEALEAVLVHALLSNRAFEQYQKGAIANLELTPFAERIASLSESYTSHRSPPPYSSQDAAAYALYYTPINFCKICLLLGHVKPIRHTPPRVLDFGCGPGTAAMACLASIRSPLSITAVDSSKEMRNLASRLVPAFAERISTSTELTVSSQIPPQGSTFDLILAANVFSEMHTRAYESLFPSFLNLLSEQGTLVLMEPALLEPTRALMQLRDALLVQDLSLHPLFPCTHREACPMLAHSATDWCHGEFEGAGKDFVSSSLVRQLDNILGFNKHRIKYACIILQRNGTTPTGYRLMRDAHVTRRGIEAPLCGKDFYGTTILSKKHLTDFNRCLRKARHYDRIISDTSIGDTLTEHSALTILS